MIIWWSLGLLSLPFLVGGYAYVGYPGLLWLAGRLRSPYRLPSPPAQWPAVSISVPAHNESATIAATIESLLALDYPPDRRQIVIISDASDDGTDEIVGRYADRGVELVRVQERRGKTAAENAAAPRLTGDIIINTDATIRIPPGSLKPLVQALQDPTVGVASGRDVSVGAAASEANRGEAGYVGYEMWVRGLETRLGGIVGASGCFYAIRRELHQRHFPEALSRDFGAALVAREQGFCAVSVAEAVCLVPRTGALVNEYRRKVRTMARGLDTLFFKAHLLNPLRFGGFAVKLLSHKLCRWLLPLSWLPAGAGLGLLAWHDRGWALVLCATLLVVLLGLMAVRWPAGRRLPGLMTLSGFLVGANLAGIQAWSKAIRGERNPIWEPTRRPSLASDRS